MLLKTGSRKKVYRQFKTILYNNFSIGIHALNKKKLVLNFLTEIITGSKWSLSLENHKSYPVHIYHFSSTPTRCLIYETPVHLINETSSLVIRFFKAFAMCWREGENNDNNNIKTWLSNMKLGKGNTLLRILRRLILSSLHKKSN